MRRANLAWRLRDAHTQLHMLRGSGLLRSVLITVLELAHVHAGLASGLAPLRTQSHMQREPGLLRSVLVTALDLAHVHAAPANSALFLPEVSLFAFVFWGAELRRRACCVLRRRNLAHGSGRSVSKKQNINALYATVYLMCARAHCVTACGSTRCAREQRR